jgi:hypothetical protein
MQRLEIESDNQQYMYVLWFTRNNTGWDLHELQIMHSGTTILPANKVQGTFMSELDMIDLSIRWCNKCLERLLGQNIPASKLLQQEVILLNRLSPDEFSTDKR